MKLKGSYTEKEILNRVKRQPTELEAIDRADRGLISKLHKELKKKLKKNNSQLPNGLTKMCRLQHEMQAA